MKQTFKRTSAGGRGWWFALALGPVLAACGVPGGAAPGRLADTKAVVITVVGATGSEVGERKVQLDGLRDVVAPHALSDRARLIVGVVSDASFTRPEVIADVSFDVGEAAGGNPFAEERLGRERTHELAERVSKRLTVMKPAPASDPFGAVIWAQSLFAQFPPHVKKLFVMLSDSVATVPHCNMTGRDLRPEYRPYVIADCTNGRSLRLAGVEAWHGGAGLAVDEPDDAMPTELALAIEDLWREFWTTAGGRLTRYGPTLVPDAPPATGGR